MKRLISLILLLALLLTACASGGAPSENAEKQEPVDVKPEGASFTIDRTYAPVAVNPVNQDYAIEKLDDIVNLPQFGDFTENQKRRLLNDYFFIAPSDKEQLFYTYELNSYNNIPSFITSDSILHSFHMFYDYTLRTLESEHLAALLEDMTSRMYQDSVRLYGEVKDQELKAAAGKNIAYFAVAMNLLAPDKDIVLPKEIQTMVEKELEKVNAAEGRGPSDIFNFDLDYTQFKPRGHYTRSDKLQRYFKAFMWYGTVPFPFEINEAPAYDSIRQAAMMAISTINDPEAYKDYKELYDITSFMVGRTDDLNIYDYEKLLKAAMGDDMRVERLSDTSILDSITAEAKKLPPPMIQQDLLNIPGGIQFRFMGQRYIPDSRILQELTHFKYRPFPKGLDVMGILGSDKAHSLLFDYYNEDEKWGKYAENYDKMDAEFNSLSDEEWRDNIYSGWLWSLKVLFEKSDSSPSFMKKESWNSKQLITGLSSWAELRHDTILYGKQSGAERGDGYSGYTPTGYVEPVPEFYNRLLWVNDTLKAYVEYIGNAGENDRIQRLSEGLNQMGDTLKSLRDISTKELEGKELTQDEWYFIYDYGALLEALASSTIEGEGGQPVRWFEITSETDRNMACVADVHTSYNECLEEGVGQANEIYVAVPIMGKIYLTRGASFSYYEFTWPTDDRLTDEKWQDLLKDGQAPTVPDWEKALISDEKSEIPPAEIE
ncbi:MAG: DUF3160 domain-containing protein [Thermoanaerobacteraceae bacterium]|nr:DUF3160 domain-containing protein [Thermoanaerobacteraceae bacterium]